ADVYRRRAGHLGDGLSARTRKIRARPDDRDRFRRCTRGDEPRVDHGRATESGEGPPRGSAPAQGRYQPDDRGAGHRVDPRTYRRAAVLGGRLDPEITPWWYPRCRSAVALPDPAAC